MELSCWLANTQSLNLVSWLRCRICAATLQSFLWRSVDVRSALPIQRGAWAYRFKALILPTREKAHVMSGTLFMKQHHRPVRNCLVTESTVSEKGILETIFICFMENAVFCFLYTFLTFITAAVLWEHLWALSAFSFTIPPKGLRSSILRGVNMEHMEAK